MIRCSKLSDDHNAKRMIPARSLLAISIAATISACAMVGPDYAPPETKMPDTWHQVLSQGLSEGKADLRTWWTSFNDPQLNALIDRATAGNLDLQTAVSRILQARANLGITAGEQLPAVDAQASLDHGRLSNNTVSEVPSARERTSTLYTTGLDATWEIDLWGRIARQVESADYSLQASIEDYRDVLVSLYAAVAASYTQVRTFQARIQAALANVESQRKTLRLVQDRREAELASDLEVAQAQSNLATTEALVPALRRQLAAQIHQLGVLLGLRPTVLRAELEETQPIPRPPKEIVIGLPAELLRQRPDVRGAERQIAAQNAQIGAATGDLYPRFTLSGFFAFESFGVDDWFKGDSLAYGLGPRMMWNVFDGGRVRSNIDLADATTDEALLNYEQTVLNALEEVETSLTNYIQENQRRDALGRSVNALQESVRLVQTLYITGLTDFQNVQDQERSLTTQEDDFYQSEGDVTLFLIELYRALGGGWSPDPDTTTSVQNAPATIGDTPPPAQPVAFAAAGGTPGDTPEPTTGAVTSNYQSSVAPPSNHEWPTPLSYVFGLFN